MCELFIFKTPCSVLNITRHPFDFSNTSFADSLPKSFTTSFTLSLDRHSFFGRSMPRAGNMAFTKKRGMPLVINTVALLSVVVSDSFARFNALLRKPLNVIIVRRYIYFLIFTTLVCHYKSLGRPSHVPFNYFTTKKQQWQKQNSYLPKR